MLPTQRRMERRGAYDVYFIFKSMERAAPSVLPCPSIPRKIPTRRVLEQAKQNRHS